VKIERVDIARYQLPLARRFRAGRVDLDQREGRLVRLRSADGLVGYGEVAPLPGVHTETLADVDAALGAVGAELAGQSFDNFGALADNVANRIAAAAPRGNFGAPSAVFGLQCAAASVFAAAEGVPPAAVLTRTPRDHVQVNALFVGAAAEAAEAIARGDLDAYGCVKVKVGQAPASTERAMLQVLLSGLDEQVKLRLDGNRALDLQDAIGRFRGLPPERIEYLEEPLVRPAELGELHAATGLGVGLDESLHEPALRHLTRAPYVVAWCLKAARIGHWKRMRSMSTEAAEHGARTIVSSCLESGLGLGWQVQLAAALPGDLGACGLGTESWLRLDIVAPAYDASRGYVRTSDWSGTPSEPVLDRLRFRRAE